MRELRLAVHALGDGPLSFFPLVLHGDPRSLCSVRAGAGGLPPFFARTMKSLPRLADAAAARGGAHASYLDARQAGVGAAHARATCGALRTALALYMLATQESLRNASQLHLQGIATLLCSLLGQMIPFAVLDPDSWSEDSLLVEVSRAAIDQGVLRAPPAGAEQEPERMCPILPVGCTISYALLEIKAGMPRAPGGDWGAWVGARTLHERVRALHIRLYTYTRISFAHSHARNRAQHTHTCYARPTARLLSSLSPRSRAAPLPAQAVCQPSLAPRRERLALFCFGRPRLDRR